MKWNVLLLVIVGACRPPEPAVDEVEPYVVTSARKGGVFEREYVGQVQAVQHVELRSRLKWSLAVAERWALERLELAYVRRVLAELGGNKAEAARVLGIERRTLYAKLALTE